MLRPDSQPEQIRARQCLPLIDLAALAEGRLGEEAGDAIIAHVASCSDCLAVLSALGAEVSAIEREARMLLVPSSVIHAAMALRKSDSATVEHVDSIRVVPSWFVYARRGAAIAAIVALALTGYHIGTTLTVANPSSLAIASTVSDDAYAFGLLDADSGSADLFSLAFADAMLKEATP